jgi:dTDP-L-rhamnose 4-epimerase
MERILVTGGAGFIGSHLVDELVRRGHRVRVLDSLDPEAHGPGALWPSYANPGAEYVLGDVRDRSAFHAALRGIDVVFHYAAAVGSGISMHRIRRYVEVNCIGTANLLELCQEGDVHPRKLIVPSSMTAMGEGTYRCPEHGVFYPTTRAPQRLARREWEPPCPTCGATAEALPMIEDRPLKPTSIYGLTKKDQEEMSLMIGRARGLPTVSFRYFSVYGRRQSMSNPYTGVLARFATRVIAGQPPLVFEDGRQLKDCIHVSDVVAANMAALERSAGDHEVFNLGGGVPIGVMEIAQAICDAAGTGIVPRLTGGYRVSDARHGWSDNAKAERVLSWTPRVSFAHGVADLLEWLRGLPGEEVRRSIETFARLEAAAEARGYAT